MSGLTRLTIVASSSIDRARPPAVMGNHAPPLASPGPPHSRLHANIKAAGGNGARSSAAAQQQFTARNRSRDTRHAAPVERCFSIFQRSLSFRRPSSIPNNLLFHPATTHDSFLLAQLLTGLTCCRHRGGPVPLAAFVRGRAPISASRSGHCTIFEISHVNPDLELVQQRPFAFARCFPANLSIACGSVCAAASSTRAARCSGLYTTSSASLRRPRHYSPRRIQ